MKDFILHLFFLLFQTPWFTTSCIAKIKISLNKRYLNFANIRISE